MGSNGTNICSFSVLCTVRRHRVSNSRLAGCLYRPRDILLKIVRVIGKPTQCEVMQPPFTFFQAQKPLMPRKRTESQSTQACSYRFFPGHVAPVLSFPPLTLPRSCSFYSSPFPSFFRFAVVSLNTARESARETIERVNHSLAFKKSAL